MKLFNTTLNNILKLIIINFIIIIFFSNELYSIPVFARKYKTACATCHVAFTKRNAIGEAFRRNGYNLPSQLQSWIKEAPLKLGADTWKDIWPDGIWPSSIPGTVPLAIYAGFSLQDNFEKSKTPKWTLDMPSDLGILVAGTFGEGISFFGSWSSEYGVSRMFFRLNDFFNLNGMFNLKFGKFEPGINDSYPYNQRLTINYNLLQSYAAAGDWSAKNTRSGFELNGILDHKFNYQIGLVNSTGYDNNDSFDKCDFYGRIGLKIGGVNLDGENHKTDAPQDFTYDYNSVLLGFFSYLGNSLRQDAIQTHNNDFIRYGADLKYSYGNLDILGGLMIGTDNKPDTSNSKISSLVYFGEVNYIIYPWLNCVLRAEHAKSKYENSLNNNDKDNFTNLIPNLTILYRQNLRISIEGFFQYQHDKNIGGTIIKGNNEGVFKNIKILGLVAF